MTQIYGRIRRWWLCQMIREASGMSRAHLNMARNALEDHDARYGRAKIVTLRRDVNALRKAIRAEGTPAVQDAWEKAERWVDRVFTTDQEGTE